MRTSVVGMAALAGLCSAATTQAAPARPERGQVVLNCRVDSAGRLSECQATAEQPTGIGFGAAVADWAAGQTMPGTDRPSAGNTALVDLPFCFNLVREPLQITPDTARKCDAMSTRPVAYSFADVVSAPPTVELFRQPVAASGPAPVVRLTREDLLKTGSSDLRGALNSLAADRAGGAPPADAVRMTCNVLSTGALNCRAAATAANLEQARAALVETQKIRLKPKQSGGKPAPGVYAFYMRLKPAP